MGISTLTAGISLHSMIFNEDFKILVIATKQDVAKNLVQKVQIMWEFLPSFLKQGLEIVNNNKLSLVFSNGSEINAVSSSPDSARSHALSLLIFDEMAFCENSDEIWTSAQATLSTGGSAILLSTPNGIAGRFHQIWQQAEEGTHEYGLEPFYPIRLPWYLHPDRDQTWRDHQDNQLGKRLAGQEYDCIWGESEVTVRDKVSGKIKKIKLNDLFDELSTTLTCKLCGYSAKQLHQHLKAEHDGMTHVEYRELFGLNEKMQYCWNPIIKDIDKKQSDQVKQTYIQIEENLRKIDRLFDKDLTRDILIEGDYYKHFLGRTKYRTLINENPQLYKSILEHTNLLYAYFEKISLGNKIKFIVEFNYDITKIQCHCGKRYGFTPYCRSCSPNYPSSGWFIWKYGEQYASIEQEKDKLNRKSTSGYHLTLAWFKDQYGENDYIDRYISHYKSRFDPCKVRYSKISQELFRILQEYIPELEYFAEEKGEWKIYLKKEEILETEQCVFYLDLFYKNKNIEFDGGYYQKTDEYISTRDEIIRNRGIEILRIRESDYKKHKKEVIQKCLEFLNG